MILVDHLYAITKQRKIELHFANAVPLLTARKAEN
jgi:hypothetical protein